MILLLQVTYKTPVNYNNILFSVQILFVTFFKLRKIQHTLPYCTVQYSGLHVHCRYCCQILEKIEFDRHFFEK